MLKRRGHNVELLIHQTTGAVSLAGMGLPLRVEERAATTGSTKTEVILEALESLRQRETEELMAQGYIARAVENRALAESGLKAAEESWPEW